MRRGDPQVVLFANPGADLYGSDRMALESVQALVASGHRVVVTAPGEGPLLTLLRDAGAEIEICPTPVIRKGLLTPRGLLSLLAGSFAALRSHSALVRRTNAGVVMVNTITIPAWLLIGRLTGRLTVCHVHEGEKSVSAVLRFALYVPLVLCHRILINSRFALDVLSGAAPWLRRRTRVVYNAVAGPRSVRPPRAALDAPVKLVYVGRLSARKGPHVAVDAVRRLVDTGMDVRLDLVGAVFPGNEEYERLLRDQVARLRLTERVRFVGFRPSVWDELAAADIVVVPSTVDEPFGNTAVEAALAARPAVVSRVGGLPEAASHSTSALLVPPGEPEPLADAVSAIAARWDDYATRAVADAAACADAYSRERYGRDICAAVRR